MEPVACFVVKIKPSNPLSTHERRSIQRSTTLSTGVLWHANFPQYFHGLLAPSVRFTCHPRVIFYPREKKNSYHVYDEANLMVFHRMFVYPPRAIRVAGCTHLTYYFPRFVQMKCHLAFIAGISTRVSSCRGAWVHSPQRSH